MQTTIKATKWSTGCSATVDGQDLGEAGVRALRKADGRGLFHRGELESSRAVVSRLVGLDLLLPVGTSQIQITERGMAVVRALDEAAKSEPGHSIHA